MQGAGGGATDGSETLGLGVGGGASLGFPRGLGLSKENRPGQRVGYTQGNSSTVRILPLWPGQPTGCVEFPLLDACQIEMDNPE